MLVFCALTTLVTSCGNTSANLNVKDVVAAIEKAAPLATPVDFTEDELIYEMSIDMENVEEYYGQRANVNGDGSAILILKAKAGKVDEVKTALENYRANTVAYLGNYPEFDTRKSLAEAGRVVTKGDYALLVIGGDSAVAEAEGAQAAYAEIDKAIDEALK